MSWTSRCDIELPGNWTANNTCPKFRLHFEFFAILARFSNIEHCKRPSDAKINCNISEESTGAQTTPKPKNDRVWIRLGLSSVDLQEPRRLEYRDKLRDHV
jgi:hypothetical protein